MNHFLVIGRHRDFADQQHPSIPSQVNFKLIALDAQEERRKYEEIRRVMNDAVSAVA